MFGTRATRTVAKGRKLVVFYVFGSDLQKRSEMAQGNNILNERWTEKKRLAFLTSSVDSGFVEEVQAYPRS